ncbi:MAG: ester cyclase [Chloroflexota bacterium]|nr:ester cyclase [Chloroflexota bacterium]
MRRLLYLITLLMAGMLTVPLVAAQDATPEATPANLSGACVAGTEEENAAVAEAYLDVWNSQDVALFDDVAHPDVIHHWGQGQDTVGREALKASTEAFFTAFPDMVITFDDVIVEDDMVVIRWTITGTQTGPFFELQPTGIEATWSGINIYRIECGQVVESWSEADAVGLRAQLQAPDDVATPAS